MSGVVDVRCGGWVVWWMSYSTHGVVDVVQSLKGGRGVSLIAKCWLLYNNLQEKNSCLHQQNLGTEMFCRLLIYQVVLSRLVALLSRSNLYIWIDILALAVLCPVLHILRPISCGGSSQIAFALSAARNPLQCPWKESKQVKHCQRHNGPRLLSS